MKDLLYLKDDQIKEFIQLLYNAYRETSADPKEILSKKFFGTAKLRALNLIERNPGINLGELIFKLKVTKQSLNSGRPWNSDAYWHFVAIAADYAFPVQHSFCIKTELCFYI